MRFPRPDRGWQVAWLVALAWATLPALPALSAGRLIGQPFTDLYPAAWGLAQFAGAQPGLPTYTHALAAPGGMGFYYSSPLHGWAGWLPWVLGGPVFAYDLVLLAARAAGVLCTFGFLRALEIRSAGALCGATIYGAAPFFHGYAVEGIVEGTDGWALPLWAWMIARRRAIPACAASWLTILSSWYLGMVQVLLAIGWGVRHRLAWWSTLVGIVLALPFAHAFLSAFTGSAPLDESVRAMMGAKLGIPRPGILPGLNVFAINAYTGFATLLLALPSVRRRPQLAVGALVCAVLSLGQGPWWDLPVISLMRFPYRWHAGTLLCLAVLAADTAQRLRWSWLGMVPLVEGLVLSPVEPVLPSAPVEVPAIYAQVTGPILLEVPGPVAMPPGVPNRSRPRARYLLYYQLAHGAASPWAPDFNGVSGSHGAAWLDGFAAYDPLEREVPGALDFAGARRHGVTQVMVQRKELGGNAQAFEHALAGYGLRKLADDGDRALYAF